MGNIPVSVTILERSYKLTIPDSEESNLHDAATLIDTQARLFKKQFKQRDNQDILAMVALTQVTDLIKIQNSLEFKETKLTDKLTEIDSLLEDSLHPTQNSL